MTFKEAIIIVIKNKQKAVVCPISKKKIYWDRKSENYIADNKNFNDLEKATDYFLERTKNVRISKTDTEVINSIK